MSGIHKTTGIPFARAGLEDAIRAALAGETVDIFSTFTWPVTERDSVHLTDARSESDPATIAPRRGMDETITLDVQFLSWRAGDDGVAAQAAYDRALGLLAKVQTYIATGDNITLGGAVLWCVPGSADVAGIEYDSGFQVEIAATFICSHKLRAI